MKKISYIIIIAGIIIISYPLLNNLYSWYMQQKIITEWETDLTLVDQSDDHRRHGGVGQSYEELNRLFLENLPKEENKQNSSIQAIGIISIDKINLKLPIVDGTTEKDLKNAAGRLEGTAKLGHIGNSAIAAHRGYSRGRLFNRLDEMDIGDKINIQTKDGHYTYEVYKILVVEPTDLSVLNQHSEESIITLITCDPLYEATHRLIVHAKQIL